MNAVASTQVHPLLAREYDQAFTALFGRGRGSNRKEVDTTQHLREIDFSSWRGCFAEGWTDDRETNRILQELTKLIGLRVVILWNEVESSPLGSGHLFSGDSDIYTLDADGCLRVLPTTCWLLLCEPDEVADETPLFSDLAFKSAPVAYRPRDFQMLSTWHAGFTS